MSRHIGDGHAEQEGARFYRYQNPTLLSRADEYLIRSINSYECKRKRICQRSHYCYPTGASACLLQWHQTGNEVLLRGGSRHTWSVAGAFLAEFPSQIAPKRTIQAFRKVGRRLTTSIDRNQWPRRCRPLLCHWSTARTARSQRHIPAPRESYAGRQTANAEALRHSRPLQWRWSSVARDDPGREGPR